ncbi:conserved hypothetical protein [Luminiphilus syltensis NOR5-1B]|uniref:VWFA domain-containing protein n=1 Tax=Luminiphilus syltensis NOR5-1B TaxID=565045 RepID=B8KRD2_9GAMM|nr:VWA domain-containing protein [Luminiphilus syltensis]EED36314.1 conserved hypothetical protein [Luminiphilus syltensis NOR5-1B]
MLEFDALAILWLLPLPVLVGWLLPAYRRREPALRIPFFTSITTAAGAEIRSGSVIASASWWYRLVVIAVWLLLLVGLAKPQWVGEPITKTETARDVMLAIDLSASMDYRDFPGPDGKPVSRFDAVQRVVDQFVANREGDRVGLIVFGAKAYLQLPFTRDLNTARALVDLMQVGMAGPQTALGDSIGLAIRAFESSEVDDRVLILLTDGNDTASKMTPINAAEIAQLNGIEIYTIGIGDAEATGEDRIDFETLASIAERSGGQFFDAQDETALRQVYDRIDALAVADIKTETWRPRVSLVHWPTGLALGLLFMVSLTALGRGWRSR